MDQLNIAGCDSTQVDPNKKSWLRKDFSMTDPWEEGGIFTYTWVLLTFLVVNSKHVGRYTGPSSHGSVMGDDWTSFQSLEIWHVSK